MVRAEQLRAAHRRAGADDVLVEANGKHPQPSESPQVSSVERLKVLGKLSKVTPGPKVRGEVTFDVMSV